MSTLEASHSSSKVLENLGRTGIGAWVNLSLKFLKDFSYFSPNTKDTTFLTSLLRGGTIVEKS